MQIPSKKQCYKLIRNMKMLDHIVAHSFQVCRVATFIVDHLDTAEFKLCRNLVQAAALLHDITKTRSFETSRDRAHRRAISKGFGIPDFRIAFPLFFRGANPAAIPLPWSDSGYTGWEHRANLRNNRYCSRYIREYHPAGLF